MSKKLHLVKDPNKAHFTNLNYLDYLVTKLRMKSILSFICLFLYVIFFGFGASFIPDQLGSTLFLVNISVVSLILMFALTYNAMENYRFYLSLRSAQKIYKKTITDEHGPTEECVNEYMQLGLDRYGETLAFKENYKIQSLEKIQDIDKKLRGFKFSEDGTYDSVIRVNLEVAMQSLNDGFDLKSIFAMPKRLYYRKWALAKLEFNWLESQFDAEID
ncbi:hypothetical protein H9S87_19040 (plasmid) [Bacillus pumilus]|uniref:hypothetical protein n=1 Tax=Bacillus pumilus TaxID=1408 RepID=UPI0016584BF5|nr:hypothetical protein [Bacillus pumilus]QNP18271.1 hypothetical protein H9S87_19040 [Bacillus pumilus]